MCVGVGIMSEYLHVRFTIPRSFYNDTLTKSSVIFCVLEFTNCFEDVVS